MIVVQCGDEITGVVLNGDKETSCSAGFIVEDHRHTDDDVAIVDYHARPSTGFDNRCALSCDPWDYNDRPRIHLE